MYNIMTPGPVKVRENVRMARSLDSTNPDLDLEFYDFYRDTCQLIGKILNTKNEVYILSGEGILGLEAACASLTEPDDRVLVLDNGIFGKSFSDFVSLYGGNPVIYSDNDRNELDVRKLRAFLEKDHNFKYATVVHCDTPSGVLNNVSLICPLLKEYGILTVVDSVSAMFGEKLMVDAGKMDIVCGGSQKALSAPPGLTFLSVSEEAFKAIEERKIPIHSFYANIGIFKDYYKKKWFPYTMPISDIYGLNRALWNIWEDNDIVSRHEKIARATRKAITEGGLSLYLEGGFCNTVTVIEVPNGIKDKEILNIMKEKYNIMIAGCFDVLEGKVIRIGHMGENANVNDMEETLYALGETLKTLGFPVKNNMKDVFHSEVCLSGSSISH